MMKFLSRLCSALLSFSVIITISAYVLAATLLSPPKLQSASESAGVSAKIAETIPDILKNNLGLSADETFIVKTVATKDEVKPYIDQLLGKIASPDGKALELNFNGLRKTIAAEGLPLPAKLDDLISTPITIIPAQQSAKLASIKHLDDQAKIIGPIVAIVLILLILVLAKQKRFLVLGEAAIMTAMGLGILGIILPGLPGIVTSTIGTSIIAPLRDTLSMVAKNLLLSAQHIYYVAATFALGFAVLSYVLHGFSKVAHKFGKKKHA